MPETIFGDKKNYITYDKKKRILLFHHTYESFTLKLNLNEIRLWNSIPSKNIVKILAISDKRIVKEYFVGTNLKNIIDPKYLDYYFEQSINTVKKIYAYFKHFPAITEKSILILPNKMIKFKEFVSPSYGKEYLSFSRNIQNLIDVFASTAKRLDHHSLLFDYMLKRDTEEDIASLLKDIDGYFYKNKIQPPKSNASFLFPPLFVGRRKEIDLLNKYMNESFSKKKAKTLVIYGDKGVGKTRLTFEFMESIRNVVKSQARASSREFSTLFTLLESFESLNKGLLQEGDIRVLKNISKLLPSAKTSIEQISNVEKVSFEVTKFLEGLRKPLIVTIDDFDEIDKKSLAVLRNQFRKAANLPIILLINGQRKEDYKKLSSKNKAFIELKTLRNKDIEALSVSLLGENTFVNESFFNWLSSISNNIPLNTIEIIKYLANSYQIFMKNGVWDTQKTNPEDFVVPSQLNELILSSYSSLDENEREILNYIVSDSQGFTSRELKEMVDIPDTEIVIVLQSLKDKNFVVSNRKRWVCSSANIRDSLYKKIPDKKKYHLKILNYLKNIGYVSMRTVDHYIRAGMLEEAAEVLFEYARSLFYIGKADYAADAVEGLIVLYNRLGRSIRGIKTFAMRVFSRAGKYQEIITTYGIGKTNDIFAEIYRLRALIHLNKISEAMELKESLESVIANYGNVTQFKILNEIAYLYYRIGHLEKALEYVQRIDELDKSGFSRNTYIELYKIKAIVYSSMGYKNKKYFDLSIDLYNIVLKLSKVENDLINEAIVYNNLGSMLMYDDNALAKKYLGQAANLFGKAENIYLKSYPLSNLAMMHFVSGQTVRGMRTINDLIDMGKNFGWEYDYIEYLKIKAQMYFFAEDMEKYTDVLLKIKESVQSEDELLIIDAQLLIAKFIISGRKLDLIKEDAERYFSYYEEKKNNAFYMVWYYYLKFFTENPRRKPKLLEKVLDYKDTLENFPFQVYHDIGASYVLNNDLNKAEKIILKLLKMSIDGGAKLFEAKAYTILGIIEAKRGNRKEGFVKLYNAKSMFKFMGLDRMVNYCDEKIETYSLSPTKPSILEKKDSLKVSRLKIKEALKDSENMIYSLMDDLYALKTFTATIFSLGKEIEIQSFASLLVDQVLGMFNISAAAFYIMENSKPSLLFAKDYQENVYKEFILPQNFLENDLGKTEASSGKSYIYIPIISDDKLGAFLYMQMHGVGHKISNMEKELLIMLPDSLSLIFQHTQLYMMAILDPLTKLYTRNYFISRMQTEFEDAKDFSLEYSIMMLDIDDFKKFNDTYGHTVGDEVLKEIALALKKTIGDLGTVGRFGGEEFIITLPIGYISSSRIAEKINKAVNDIKIDGVDRMVSVSIGIASYPYTDAKDYLELLDKADSALYVTKASGKNSYTIFEKKYVS